MSKKQRFNKPKQQIFRPPIDPKTVITIIEEESTKQYKSYNTYGSAIKKLAKNSSLPSHFFYDLAKNGIATQEMSTGKLLTITVEAWTPELEKQIEEQSKS